MKAYRHADDSIWSVPAGGERRADGPLEPPPRLPVLGARLPPGRRRPVEVDPAGCPHPDGGKSLHPAAFMFASEKFLGVRPSRQHVTFMVIPSPAGSYFQRAASSR